MGKILLEEIASPGTPATNKVALYPKAGGMLYFKNDEGTEYQVGTLTDLLADLTPQLGGMLDVNGYSLGDGTLELLSFLETASAVNEFTIKNAATGSGPELRATGGDTNIDINIVPKGTGKVNFADFLLGRATFIDVAEKINILGDLAGGTDTINLELGNVATATVSTSAQTFTFTNPPATGNLGGFLLFLTNGGSQVTNWPSGTKWPGGVSPILTTAGVDILIFMTINGGTNWYGFVRLDLK